MLYTAYIITAYREEQPAVVVVERQDHLQAYGRLPAQGDQPVVINRKHIGWVGAQPVVRDEHLRWEYER